MTSQVLALQKAIYAALAADGAVAALVGARIYDSVPESPTFPYITIGEAQGIDDGADCLDGEEVIATLHVWSREPGGVEAKEIGGAIKDALHEQELLLETGFALCDLRFRDSLYRLDPDGVTTHGILQFVGLTESS